MSKLTVSIIIVSRNRHQALRRCLESIVSAYSRYAYDELILIDSSDEAEADNNQQLAEALGVIYRWKSSSGISPARNTGIRLAGGDILVFADDDFIVDRDWVRNLMPNYEDEKVMGCTGRMLPYRHDEVSNVFYRTLGYDRGAMRRVFSADDVALVKLFKTVQSIGRLKLGDKAPVPWSIGSGFLSFRRCVFDKVGYFDEKLCDTRIHTLCGGEDVDMLYRVLKNNHKVVYEPKAVIGHDEPQTIEGIVRKSYSYGIGRQLLFSKYRKDRYMLALCIGDFFFLTFAWIGAVLRAERAERKLVAAGMKGSFFGIYASLRSSIISRR